MARRKKPKLAVYPPRPHRRRWRIEIRDGVTGNRSRPSFDSEEEAWKDYHKALKEAAELDEPTLGELIEIYLTEQVEKGLRPKSIRSYMYHLEAFFEPILNINVRRLTPRRCEELYRLRRQGTAADSHRNGLARAKAFGRWLVKTGRLKKSPVKDVEPIGKRRRGKLQLVPGEARLFLNRAIELSGRGSDAAFACAVTLVMGLRPSEITRRVVRDVDAATRLLFIEEAKTEHGNRRVEIPAVLWPQFEQRIQGREAQSQLLPGESDGGFHCEQWVGKFSKRLCQRLGLPEVCAQGLRGTHATLAREAGSTGHAVAMQLGHGDSRVTDAHYTKASAVERSRQRRALEVLVGGAEWGKDG
ncbi:MAG: tyrosine-type recombinase/integrase [Planctomycetota bacterium]